MNGKFRILIAAILVSILFIGIAAGETQSLNATIFDMAQGYGIPNTAQNINVKVLTISFTNTQYLSGITSLTISKQNVVFPDWKPENVQSWSSNAIIGSGSSNFSTGMLYAYFISNTTPTNTYYQIVYVPTTMNFVGGSGSITNARLYYSQPLAWETRASFYMGTVAAIPSSQPYAFFSNGTYFASGGADPAGAGASDSTSWKYNFKTSVNVTNSTTGGYVVNVQRNFAPDSYYSIISLSDGISTFATYSGGWNDFSVTSFSPPIYATIWDGYTGYNWTKAFYYPAYSVNANPSSGGTTTPISLNFLSSSGFFPSDLNQITYDITPAVSYSTTLYDNNVTTKHLLNFYKIGTTWYQWGGYSYNIPQTSIPQWVSTTIPTPGNYSVYVSWGSSLIPGANTAGFNISIAGAAPITINEIPVDGPTGSFISGANISIFNGQTGTWVQNKTVNQISDCAFQVTPGYYTIWASAANYYSNTNGQQLISSSVSQNIPLYPLVNNSASNTTVNVNVVSSSGAPVSGATVTFTPGLTSLVVNSAGTGTIQLLNGTQYHAVASASGFQSTSKYFTPAGQTTQLTLIMSPVGVTITATPTLPAAVGTPVNGNYNGFFGPIFNGMASAGIIPSEMGILMAGLFIFAGACVGGFAAASMTPGAPFNGTVAIIGAGLGFMGSVAFGFISFVWVIVIIVFGLFAAIFFHG